jgi:hypothetical protein
VILSFIIHYINLNNERHFKIVRDIVKSVAYLFYVVMCDNGPVSNRIENIII